jgi:hypothetical protein
MGGKEPDQQNKDVGKMFQILSLALETPKYRRM